MLNNTLSMIEKNVVSIFILPKLIDYDDKNKNKMIILDH